MRDRKLIVMQTELDRDQSARCGDAAGIDLSIAGTYRGFSRLWENQTLVYGALLRNDVNEGFIKSAPDDLDGTGGIQERSLPGAEQRNTSAVAHRVRRKPTWCVTCWTSCRYRTGDAIHTTRLSAR